MFSSLVPVYVSLFGTDRETYAVPLNTAMPTLTYTVYMPVMAHPPTATPTSTPLPPTATAIPPTATPINANGVVVQQVDSWFSSSGSYFNIVGEVVNNTSSSIRSVRVPIRVFDSIGLVDAVTDSFFDTIGPGARYCFIQIVSNFSDRNSVYYEFGDVTYSVSELEPHNIHANTTGRVLSSGGYRVAGSITNNGGSLSEVWIR